MSKFKKPFVSFFFLFCLVGIPALYANELEEEKFWQNKVKEFDAYWKQREENAEKDNHAAYNPNPYEVSVNLSASLSDEDLTDNGTGRKLGGVDEKCRATNPIDRCWRCDPNWANNRQKLADCVKGFGRNTVGGKGGPIYVVTDPSDNDVVNVKPGTLRHAVTRTGPLWIIFDRSMIIRLTQELIMTGDKTIDGRGAEVHITNGAGITIQFIKNVIIHNVKIYNIKVGQGGMIRDSEDHFGLRSYSDGDGISIFGSSNIWIDHVSMSNCEDGLIDAIMGSTAITISNSHFTDHNEVMLFGASDSYTGDKIMQVTLAFNHFGQGLVQRMPRCRHGFFHVVNNDYTHWKMYAIGGSKNPTVISEGNRFIAPDDIYKKEVTKREYSPESEWSSWQWRSINDEFLNGAYFKQGGSEMATRPFSRHDMIKAKPGKFVKRLTRYSGRIFCVVGKPC